MGNEMVHYALEEKVGIITIDRPDARNALNHEIFSKLSELLDRIAADDDVRAVVITGAGSSFVAGADLKELAAMNLIGGWTHSRICQSIFTKIERLGKPSIAAINGVCLGGGLELALACTFRVASTKAKIGFPELRLGVITGFGGTKRAMKIIGSGKTAELLFFGEFIDGAEAYRIGLANRIAEPDQVASVAREMAASLCSLSPVASRFALELLLESEGAGTSSGLALESALAALAVSSEEARRLIGGFLSKGSGKEGKK